MPQIPVAQIVPATQAEGPGTRCAIWVQGCPLRCPECCNPEFLPFSGGTLMPPSQLAKQILKPEGSAVEGITLIGGEPFAHAAALAELTELVRPAGLSVMVFTGYTLQELQLMADPAVDRLLQQTDLLVDGRYDRTRPDTTRRWIGSINQQIHFLSDRYTADDPCWRQPDTLEIRLQGNQLTVNGFPAASAVDMWKRPSSGGSPS